MNIIDLSSKKYIVTGAGSGIGRETAKVLSEQGARVVMLDLNQQGLEETLTSMKGTGHLYNVCDLTDFEALSSLVEEVVEQCGKIDGLVHCAGISSRKPLNMLKAKGFSKVMDVNFYSFVELVRLATKKKNFNNGGSIVVMSSVSSVRGYKAKSEYCVSKAAVDAFVRCMALELADRKIRVNSVMPAEVLTPLAQKARKLNESIGAANTDAPLGASDPYEIANTIAFLLSDATKTITGTSILIDGGACI